MTNKDILEKIKKLSNDEKRNIGYEELTEIINKLSPDEIIELSKIIGYSCIYKIMYGCFKT